MIVVTYVLGSHNNAHARSRCTKEQDRENAMRILSKCFVLMTTDMYSKREYRKYIFKAAPEQYIYGLAYYI